MPDRQGRRVGACRRGVIRYASAALVFGLLAWHGVNALRQDAPAVGVPLLVTGLAGASGAAVNAVAVSGLHQRRAGGRHHRQCMPDLLVSSSGHSTPAGH